MLLRSLTNAPSRCCCAVQQAYIGYNAIAGGLLAKGLSGQIFTQIR